MRKSIVLAIGATLLLVPATSVAQDDILADLEASRATFCESVASEFDITQAECESFLEEQRFRFFVMDMDLMEDSGSTSGSGSSSSSASSARDSESFSGKGSKVTAPFELSGGDYKVDLNVLSPCAWISIDLERADGQHISGSFLEQSGYIYGVEPGRHYWDVGTSSLDTCKWSISMSSL